jgi:hypothetical protein
MSMRRGISAQRSVPPGVRIAPDVRIVADTGVASGARVVLGVMVAIIVMVMLSMAGCGRTASTPSPGGTVSTSASSAESGRPSTTPTSLPAVTRTPPKSFPAGEMAVRGVVEEGVEAGCTILRSDTGTTYLLLGGDRATLSFGRRVEVVGVPKPDLVTTCQQGVPFMVTSARGI